jgi:hypothetical protein
MKPHSTTFHDATLGLRRPEYISSPEALISSLAWTLNGSQRAIDEDSSIGRVFLAIGEGSIAKHVRRVEHHPRTTEEFRVLGDALKCAGMMPDDLDPVLVAEGTLNSIAGIRPTRGKSQAVSPLTPHLALLQNTRGLTGKRNPPDIAFYLQQLFSLGAPTTREMLPANGSVARLWLEAARERLKLDDLLNVVDKAVQEALLHGLSLEFSSEPRMRDHLSVALIGSGETPCTWFRAHWTVLTSKEWVEALPARVWTDWALTVLRLAVGMGYLWEAHWYNELAKTVIAPPTAPVPGPAQIIAGIDEVLPWRARRASVSIRDVSSRLKLVITRGQLIRETLDALNKADPDLAASSFEEGILKLRSNVEVREQLREALLRRDSKKSTVWETVRYALLTRDDSAAQADYYGLLRMNGPRYLIVEPGTEWIAVVASLSAGSPGGTTNLGELLQSLEALGLKPDMTDVIDLLERAGLARGSADADQGVMVSSAY